MRILLVEDHPDIAENVCEFLAAKGHQVNHVLTGEDGLTQARATPFDIIVLDVMLPGMDGLAVCRTLRSDIRSVAPVLPGFTFFTNEIRNPVQVEDLAAALLELAALDVSGPLHVAGADAVSRATFAELIVGAPVVSAPAADGRPLDCSFDSSRAQALLRTRLRGVHDVLG